MDDRYLISGSKDQKIIIWDAVSFDKLHLIYDTQVIFSRYTYNSKNNMLVRILKSLYNQLVNIVRGKIKF